MVAWMQAALTFVVSPPIGQPGYVVTVRNKNWFSSTEGLIFSFRLLADGVPIKQEAEEGWTQFDIAQIAPQVLLPLLLLFVIRPSAQLHMLLRALEWSTFVYNDGNMLCCKFLFAAPNLKLSQAFVLTA